jgi:hypothetical protein
VSNQPGTLAEELDNQQIIQHVRRNVSSENSAGAVFGNQTAYGDRTPKNFHMLGTGLALVVFAYGLGCLNAGCYLLRWRDGRDLRELGSG